MRKYSLFLVMILLVVFTENVVLSQQHLLRLDELPTITPDNIDQLIPIAQIGNGGGGQPIWVAHGNALVVNNGQGVWIHESDDIVSPPTLIAEGDTFRKAVFSGDGLHLIMWNYDIIQFWDVATNSCLEPCPLPFHSPIYDLLLNAAGSRLVVLGHYGPEWGEEREVIFYDLINGEEINRFHFSHGVAQFELTTDGMSFIVGATDQTLVIDIENGEVIQQYQWSLMSVNPSNPNQGLLYDDSVHLIDIASGATLQEFEPLAAQLFSFSFYSGNFVHAQYWNADYTSNHVIWSIETGKIISQFAQDNFQLQNHWLILKEENVVTIYDILTGQAALQLDASALVALHPDSVHVAVMIGTTLSIWNLMTGEQEIISEDFYFTPGNLIAVSHVSDLFASQFMNTVFVWDADTATKLYEWNVPEIAYQWAFSPDGQYLTGSTHAEIFLFDVRNGEAQELETLDGDYINDFAFSADGQYIATGSGVFQYCPDNEAACPVPDRSVHIWDRDTGEQIALIENDSSGWGIYSAVAFSPDGHWLATANLSSSIKLWDISRLQTGNIELRSTIQPNDQVVDMAFSPDGTQLAVGYGVAYSNDGFAGIQSIDVSIWRLSNVLMQAESDEATPYTYLSLLWGNKGVTHINYDNIGEFLVTTGSQVSTVWQIGSVNPSLAFARHVDIAFIAGNRVLIMSSNDGTIRLWGVPSTEE